MTMATVKNSILTIGVALTFCFSALGDEPAKTRELQALLVTGGCCHDYTGQKKIIADGISGRANVRWTIVQEGGDSLDHKVSIYNKPDWAEPYDVVVHNECFGRVVDRKFIAGIIDAHRRGTPAVVIHCTMHTFGSLKTDEWREFLGVTTTHHGPQQPLEVKNLAPSNPIMTGFPSLWTTGNEELYAIDKVWPDTVPLAQAYGLDNKRDHVVIWTHTFGKGRVFGTTIAHNNATLKDPVYLDMLTRGLLWSCDKLENDGKPKAGYAAVPPK
jgi:type 1 glutamine amidotransferase